MLRAWPNQVTLKFNINNSVWFVVYSNNYTTLSLLVFVVRNVLDLEQELQKECLLVELLDQCLIYQISEYNESIARSNLSYLLAWQCF